MADPLVVRIDDLRSALTRVLTATEQRLGREVVIEQDYYWDLPVDAAFDMSQQPRPSSLSAGQLSDDMLTIQEDETVPEAAWHDLHHLVGVLRVLELYALR